MKAGYAAFRSDIARMVQDGLRVDGLGGRVEVNWCHSWSECIFAALRQNKSICAL